MEWLVNNESVRLWKEAYYSHLPEGTDKSHKNLRQDSQFPGQDLNWEPSKYKSEALSFEHLSR
jgi:hypothetical protein